MSTRRPRLAHNERPNWSKRDFTVSAHTKFTAIERARETAASRGLAVHPYHSAAREVASGRYSVTLSVAPGGGLR